MGRPAATSSICPLPGYGFADVGRLSGLYALRFSVGASRLTIHRLRKLRPRQHNTFEAGEVALCDIFAVRQASLNSLAFGVQLGNVLIGKTLTRPLLPQAVNL